MRSDEIAIRYAARVYRLACRLVGRDDAPDVVQEGFLSVYRNFASFRQESRFGTWLYRIVTNAALMHRRARTRRPVESLEAFLPEFDRPARPSSAVHQRRRFGDDAIEPCAEPRLLPERGAGGSIHGQKPLLHDVRRIVAAGVAVRHMALSHRHQEAGADAPPSSDAPAASNSGRNASSDSIGRRFRARRCISAAFVTMR